MGFTLSHLPLPVRLRPDVPLSDDELLCFSAQNGDLRMEREANGDILVMTPAGFNTGKMNMRLSRLLDEWAEADGRGVAFDSSTGFSLVNGAIRSPDAAWIVRERCDALSAAEQEGFARICPDFVIELTSPSDRLSAVKRKMEEWMANGVSLGWLIDPKSRTVIIYRAGGLPRAICNPEVVRGEGPVGGFELILCRLWGKTSGDQAE